MGKQVLKGTLHASIERTWNKILVYTTMFNFLIQIWFAFEFHSRECAKKF